jgi:hypothetical protein
LNKEKLKQRKSVVFKFSITPRKGFQQKPEKSDEVKRKIFRGK